MSTLNTANPCIELKYSSYVDDMVSMGKKLHMLFTHRKVDDDWFKLVPMDVKLINKCLIKNNING